jgi:glycosyltransferase involved in cell wall biosynthesis
MKNPISIELTPQEFQSTDKKHSPLSPKILCLGMGWFPLTAGGLSRYLHGLSCELANQGSQVEVCGLGMSEADIKDQSANLTLTNLAEKTVPVLSRFQQIRSNLKKSHLSSKTAINLHFALYSFPILNKLPSDIPVTFHFHGPWAFESQQEGSSPIVVWLKKQLELMVYHRCDRFIVLSQAFGEILHKEYDIDWEKIHIIPGGVDTQEFQPNLTQAEARAQLGWKADRKILFTPRRLVHRMGIDRLLQAMVEVRKQVPEVWLGIAGKGPIAHQLQQRIQDLDLVNHVELLGFIPDELLSVAYQAADITVVPSLSLEGFGLILVESLAAGTPAISTPVGGMPEILRPLDDALVTDSTESSAIAERLIEFLQGDRSLPSRETCREYTIQNFDWSIIGPKVQNILLMPK